MLVVRINLLCKVYNKTDLKPALEARSRGKRMLIIHAGVYRRTASLMAFLAAQHAGEPLPRWEAEIYSRTSKTIKGAPKLKLCLTLPIFVTTAFTYLHKCENDKRFRSPHFKKFLPASSVPLGCYLVLQGINLTPSICKKKNPSRLMRVLPVQRGAVAQPEMNDWDKHTSTSLRLTNARSNQGSRRRAPHHSPPRSVPHNQRVINSSRIRVILSPSRNVATRFHASALTGSARQNGCNQKRVLEAQALPL